MSHISNNKLGIDCNKFNEIKLVGIQYDFFHQHFFILSSQRTGGK
jgi:hypothetical protein